jgi:hypothetical protein
MNISIPPRPPSPPEPPTKVRGASDGPKLPWWQRGRGVVATAEKIANETKVFTGSATENLGTVNVETESVLTWTCSGCSESNFIINSSSGPTSVLVNSLKETSGHTVIDEGTYKDFDVEGEGAWTVRVSPNG